MTLNHAQVFRAPPPVTRPPINLPPLDTKTIEAEAREAQARVRTIRAGRDAWEQIAKSGFRFSLWVDCGNALAVGRAFALRVSGASRPMGQVYCKAFSEWIDQHGFATMPKSTRSVAIELAEHAAEIEAWRSTLPEKQRRRLVHPLSNVARWKASLTHGNGKSPQDLRRDAKAAWTRFCACLTALPADEARPLWESVAAEAAIEIAPQNLSNKKALREGAACGP